MMCKLHLSFLSQKTKPFERRVFELVRQVPFLQLATYGQVADWMGAHGGARQVGWALRRLPSPLIFPGIVWLMPRVRSR